MPAVCGDCGHTTDGSIRDGDTYEDTAFLRGKERTVTKYRCPECGSTDWNDTAANEVCE